MNCYTIIWAASWQNQQNGMCAQRRLGSAWASAQSDQTGRMPRLICLCWAHLSMLVLSRGGSFAVTAQFILSIFNLKCVIIECLFNNEGKLSHYSFKIVDSVRSEWWLRQCSVVVANDDIPVKISSHTIQALASLKLKFRNLQIFGISYCNSRAYKLPDQQSYRVSSCNTIPLL